MDRGAWFHYSPLDSKESDTTERLTLSHFFTFHFHGFELGRYESYSNPLTVCLLTKMRS